MLLGSKEWKDGRGESGPDLCATSSDNDSDTLKIGNIVCCKFEFSANFTNALFEFSDFKNINQIQLVGSATQFSNRLRITPKRNSAVRIHIKHIEVYNRLEELGLKKKLKSEKDLSAILCFK